MDSKNDARTTPELEEIVNAAVERQVTEQRELQDVLNGIKRSVTDLQRTVADAGATPPTATLPDELLTDVRDALVALRAVPASIEALSEALESLSAVPASIEALSEALEALSAVPASIEALREARAEPSVEDAVGPLKETVDTAAADVTALAQAVIDLNGGIREWAERLEKRLSELSTNVSDGMDGVMERTEVLRISQQKALDTMSDHLVASMGDLTDGVKGVLRETVRKLDSRLDGVEAQLVESSDLSRYLRDQTEDLDKVLQSIGDVPQRLEGAVAQALKRALTVRAGLLAEAEKTLEKVFSPLEGKLDELVERLTSATDAVSSEQVSEELRKVALRQVEMDSRIDDLQDMLLGRLDEISEQMEALPGQQALLERLDDLADRVESLPAPKAEGAEKKTEKKKVADKRASERGGKKSPAKKKASATRKKSSGKGSGRTRKAAGKTRTRDFIPV